MKPLFENLCSKANVLVQVSLRCFTQDSLSTATVIGEYVRSLMFSHEMSPAPGAAQRSAGETTLSKRSWRQKWEDCKSYVLRHRVQVPGSPSMLKRAWKMEERLKERASKSHAKCDICANIDAEMFSLIGQKGQEVEQERSRLQKSFKEHE